MALDSSITIRSATSADDEAVGTLLADVYLGERYTHASYESVLRDTVARLADTDVLLAADETGRVVGTVTYAEPPSHYAEVAREGEAAFRLLAVSPLARGKGVGERLVQACVERARAHGRSHLVLSTQPNMTTAHRLYERMGFTRSLDRDWSPLPGLQLRVYVLPL